MRKCGECTLCCRLLPVRDLEKPDNTRCEYQRHRKGCAVYGSPKMPMCCTYWSCRWVLEDDTADLQRPDRSHLVIDLMPDFVTIQENDGAKREIEVVQVWVDPRHAKAYKNRSFLDYAARRAMEQKLTLLRWGAYEGAVLLAPVFTGHDEWILADGKAEVEHSPEALHNRLGFNWYTDKNEEFVKKLLNL